jgi:hypothetical protein
MPLRRPRGGRSRILSPRKSTSGTSGPARRIPVAPRSPANEAAVRRTGVRPARVVQARPTNVTFSRSALPEGSIPRCSSVFLGVSACRCDAWPNDWPKRASGKDGNTSPKVPCYDDRWPSPICTSSPLRSVKAAPEPGGLTRLGGLGPMGYTHVSTPMTDLANGSRAVPEHPQCIVCGALTPETTPDQTLTTGFGWRVTLHKLADKTRTVEYRCPACWKRQKALGAKRA